MKQIFGKKIILVLFLLGWLKGYSQTNVPQGINYQGIARNTSGSIISNQSIAVKVGIISGSSTGPLVWEEIHNVNTNQYGLFNFIIGQGASTGNGSNVSFSLINWSSASHFISTALDQIGGISFVPLDTMQFWSVPYALHSGSSGQVPNSIRLNDLEDVDTIGVVSGNVLKWNGTMWKPSVASSDTALFALNADYAVHSDTSLYSINQLSLVDTINFAYNSDTSSFSLNAGTSLSSVTSIYCDTAAYAFNSGSVNTYWSLTGNAGTNPLTDFIGTTDNKDLVFKTNSTERLRILSNGKIGIGTATPTASFQINGNDGLLALGTFGSGASAVLGAGTRFHWYSKKAAFRAGYVSGAQWDDVNIGIYSFSGGNSNTASGAYSTAMGQFSIASGANSVGMGYACQATQTSAISLGSACQATGVYSAALGRGIIASDSAAIGIGYHSVASGKFSLAFGAYTNATGNYSTTMGWYANSNGKKGSFVYADNSSTVATNSTADNQFVVRASGGVLLYSNSGLTAGVSLPSGGGSWASVSDRNKKENFMKVDGDQLLKSIELLEVTSWNYKTQSSSIRHIGPMAQDFYKAFNYGESDTTITSIDIDGINLIAIKTLALKTTELKKSADEVEQLKFKIEKLEKEKRLLEKRIVLLEKQFIINQSASARDEK